MYKVINRNGSVFGTEPYTCEFMCDTASDILSLPTSTTVGTGGKTKYDNQICGSGSIATIIANDTESKKYVLNNQDVWCPYRQNGSEDASIADNSVSNESNPVSIDGLQGGVPFSEMVVSGKNLIPYPYYDGTSKTLHGITYTVNSDGSVTANGTATAVSAFYFLINYKFKGTNTDLFLSGCPNNGSRNTYDLVIAGLDISNNVTYANNDVGIGKSINIPSDIVAINVYIRIQSKQTVENLVFRPQLEIGSTATAYEQPITGRDLTVNVCGKNLLKYPYVDTTKTSYGITFTDNGDGSINASGTHNGNTKTAYFSFMPWWANAKYDRLFLPKGNTVSLKSNGLPITYNTMLVAKSTNNGADTIKTIYAAGENAVVYTATQDCYIACGIMGSSNSIGKTVDFTVHPQLELGDTATDYEPYHGSTATITPDSNPYTVPNDIRQQDGYNIVSVSAGKISVTGVRKNAAIKKIWDNMGMDLLFDGVTDESNPAVFDLTGYKIIEINHIIISNEKTYPVAIRMSIDNYLATPSNIINPIHSSSISTNHSENGNISSLYAVSTGGSAMTNTKIYGIK